MSENLNNDELIALAREVLAIESRAVDSLRTRLDDDFAAACNLIDNTPGRVVVTGMGKSGHISSKIAATLASIPTTKLKTVFTRKIVGPSPPHL